MQYSIIRLRNDLWSVILNTVNSEFVHMQDQFVINLTLFIFPITDDHQMLALQDISEKDSGAGMQICYTYHLHFQLCKLTLVKLKAKH